MGEQRSSVWGRAKRHPLLIIALSAWLLGVVAVVFLPVGWELNRFVVQLYYFGRTLGVPRFIGLDWYDVGLNMLLFAVPTALAALVWPRARRWVWILAVLAASSAIELVQYAALPRDASVWDVIANTAGAGLAVLLVILGERAIRTLQRN